MRQYSPIGLLGTCGIELRQGLEFLLAAYRYQPREITPRTDSIEGLKLILVIGPVSKEAYQFLYEEQSLPVVLWGVDFAPKPLSSHVHTVKKQIGGGEFIQILDTLVRTHHGETIVPSLAGHEQVG